MKLFQAVALVLMAAFFVWLLLQMSRTARSDQRLIAMALAFAGVILAFGSARCSAVAADGSGRFQPADGAADGARR